MLVLLYAEEVGKGRHEDYFTVAYSCITCHYLMLTKSKDATVIIDIMTVEKIKKLRSLFYFNNGKHLFSF